MERRPHRDHLQIQTGATDLSICLAQGIILQRPRATISGRSIHHGCMMGTGHTLDCERCHAQNVAKQSGCPDAITKTGPVATTNADTTMQPEQLSDSGFYSKQTLSARPPGYT